MSKDRDELFNAIEKPGIALGRACAGRWTGSFGKARYV